MARYIGKRVLTMIPVLIGVSLLIFLLLELAPGDAIPVHFRRLCVRRKSQ